ELELAEQQARLRQGHRHVEVRAPRLEGGLEDRHVEARVGGIQDRVVLARERRDARLVGGVDLCCRETLVVEPVDQRLRPGWIEVGEGHPLEEVAFLRDRSCSRADAAGADDEDLHASAPRSRRSSSTSSCGSPRSTRPSRPVTAGAAQSAFTTASSVASTVAAKSGSRSRPPSWAELGEVEKATKISPLP